MRTRIVRILALIVDQEQQIAKKIDRCENEFTHGSRRRAADAYLQTRPGEWPHDRERRGKCNETGLLRLGIDVDPEGFLIQIYMAFARRSHIRGVEQKVFELAAPVCKVQLHDKTVEFRIPPAGRLREQPAPYGERGERECTGPNAATRHHDVDFAGCGGCKCAQRVALSPDVKRRFEGAVERHISFELSE